MPNDEGESPGWVDLPTATALSVNSVYVALGLDAGLDNVVRTGHQLGIASPLHSYSSLSLGTEPVRPVEMAAVYGTFAGGGIEATPHVVDRVFDRTGRTLYKAADDRRRALSPQVAADATYAMQQVVLRGTGTAAQLADGRPVAGKTGTTDGYRSAWFCGYDPHIAAVVAMFRGDGSNRAPKLRNILGVQNVYGGTLPARVWKAFMDGALAGTPIEQFPAPAYIGVKASISPAPPPLPTPSRTPTPSPAPTPSPTPSPTPTPTPTPTPKWTWPTVTLSPTPTRTPPGKPGWPPRPTPTLPLPPPPPPVLP